MSATLGRGTAVLRREEGIDTGSMPLAKTEVAVRPSIRGKFLFVGEEKFFVRGVTYGAFRPDEDKREYHDLARVERDFARMAACGINTVRIPHTMPPRALLDIAHKHGLKVMVGLSAEQYAGYLIDTARAPDIAGAIREKVASCAGHPALLCYALGNEIPAQLVRWIGPRRIERYLRDLYRAVKAEDPGGLVTYVNYPTTEYLHLPFLDLVSFNVYLETQDTLEAYLARLQNIAGERPLILSELGLDSLRNGADKQASTLDWQIRATFAAGAAGAFVFAWTDEWHRGGEDVEDWLFGITDRERRPKPALHAVQRAYEEAPFAGGEWPRVSVVVCTYNGSRTIRDCLDGLAKLQYPNYEVIVVDDGSTDGTAELVRGYDVRLVQTENRGLSCARNLGLELATGEIVAYTDDDAWPDPHWLHYLAHTFRTTRFAAVGGPNLPPPGDGFVAEAVANAPGGPTHVLLSDRVAEHIPGCNMAFRVEQLRAIGGFDPQFRSAGDDVDVCWRIQQAGWEVGFHPAALVWHHRRASLRTFWNQQKGYGKAEAMLQVKWPEKYNVAGHVVWGGRVYGRGLQQMLGRVQRVYHGVWGLAPFQSVTEPPPGLLQSLPLMPEWYLVLAGLAGLTALGSVWSPLLWTAPLCLLALGASLAQALLGAVRASYRDLPAGMFRRQQLRATTALLHLAQPLARLVGRVRHGLTPFRARELVHTRWPRTLQLATMISGPWESPQDKLTWLETSLRKAGAAVKRGGEFARWDLELSGGLLGGARLLLSVEDLCPGMQLVRSRSWPRLAGWGLTATLVLSLLAGAAAADSCWSVGIVLALASAAMLWRAVREAAYSQSTLLHVLGSAEQQLEPGDA
ncbi:MAG TPA: glycosyltransferase [Polyangiales bacterium]|nr:glycosyltransferase [Polyangiales bacterium]